MLCNGLEEDKSVTALAILLQRRKDLLRCGKLRFDGEGGLERLLRLRHRSVRDIELSEVVVGRRQIGIELDRPFQLLSLSFIITQSQQSQRKVIMQARAVRVEL